MIRSLGAEAVERFIAAEGELTRLRTFCLQPVQRGRAPEQQLRRFMGTKSGRKARYGRVLAAALDLARVPHPLDGVLAHVAAARPRARRRRARDGRASWGCPALLGPAGRARDLALALIISRVVRPGSKLSTLAWWYDTTWAPTWASPGVHRRRLRRDGLAGRPAGRDRGGAGPPPPGPGGEPVADGAVRPVLAPGWRARTARWPPAGTPGTARRARLQIEYGLLTDPDRPPGRDPGLRREHRRPDRVHRDRGTWCGTTFGLERMVMVGDRGMITSARIDALNQRAGPRMYGWITALRAPAIRKLMADDGPLQLSACSTSRTWPRSPPRLPRRAADRLPQPGARRRARPQARGPARRHREAAGPGHRPRRRRAAVRGRTRSGSQVGKVISKYKMAKHFDVTITDTSLAIGRDQASIEAEAALDGIYVIRTPLPADDLDAAGVVTAYKNLATRRTGLPAHQIRRPGPAARLPPARRAGQSPRADLHARRLPDLAPAPGLGAADLHRRSTRPPRPTRSPRPAAPRRPGQGLPPARPGTAGPTTASAACSPTWPP